MPQKNYFHSNKETPEFNKIETDDIYKSLTLNSHGNRVASEYFDGYHRKVFSFDPEAYKERVKKLTLKIVGEINHGIMIEILQDKVAKQLKMQIQYHLLEVHSFKEFILKYLSDFVNVEVIYNRKNNSCQNEQHIVSPKYWRSDRDFTNKNIGARNEYTDCKSSPNFLYGNYKNSGNIKTPSTSNKSQNLHSQIIGNYEKMIKITPSINPTQRKGNHVASPAHSSFQKMRKVNDTTVCEKLNLSEISKIELKDNVSHMSLGLHSEPLLNKLTNPSFLDHGEKEEDDNKGFSYKVFSQNSKLNNFLENSLNSFKSNENDLDDEEDNSPFNLKEELNKQHDKPRKKQVRKSKSSVNVNAAQKSSETLFKYLGIEDF
jgi:hypothetical protein